jgi:peptide/nickel transport system ATP-binding protein
MGSRHVLSINDLTVAYTTRRGTLLAVKEVSLNIGHGQVLGLAGESGSGKSTIGHAILGLLAAEASVLSGSVCFEGVNLFELSARQQQGIRGRKIGVVFQDPFTSLNPSLPVARQVAEPLIFHQGLGEPQAIAVAVDLLAQVGIPRPKEVGKAYPHQLSGGMQQRVLIATALTCEPSLLILDEPTTALDVTIEAQILDLLDDLRTKRSLSILFISHNLEVLGRLCDEVCILYAGEIVEHGPAKDLFGRPFHPYTKGLLASMPKLTRSGRGRQLSFIPGNLPELAHRPVGCVFHPRCPFQEQSCKEDRQRFVAMSEAHQALCWKAEQLKDQAWIVGGEASSTEERAPVSAQKEPGPPLIQAQKLTKEFRLGSTLSNLKFDFGGSAPWISYQPFRLKAVDEVTLEFHSGEVVGLVGESGSGKSTLGRCLVRLLEPTAGRILLRDKDVTREPEGRLKTLRQDVQIIFQNPDSSLNPRKTVGQILSRPLVLFGLAGRKKVESRVHELLEMVRLTSAHTERYPHQLSGGEKQRVGIARALATSPRFIVCDEAVSALDVSVQSAILNLLGDLRAEFDLTYLFISHDLSVVAHLSDRVAVMYRGLICETGKVGEVLNPPYHPYTEALLSAIPSLESCASHRRIRLKEDLMMSGATVSGCRFHPRCPRRIGLVCEQQEPPVVQVSRDHTLLCHIPLEELGRVPPVF